MSYGMMNRILVIGCAGAGKSTLARVLGARHGLPVVHLDHLYWAPGWAERPPGDFDRALETALRSPQWVMDGNYTRTMPARLPYADLVVFLDMNRFLCLLRVIARVLRREGAQAPGCPQKVDWAFLKYIALDYPRHNRREILRLRAADPVPARWVTLTSPRAVRAWLCRPA